MHRLEYGAFSWAAALLACGGALLAADTPPSVPGVDRQPARLIVAAPGVSGSGAGALHWSGKNAMPPFRGMLSPEQLRDVAHYNSEELF